MQTLHRLLAQHRGRRYRQLVVHCGRSIDDVRGEIGHLRFGRDISDTRIVADQPVAGIRRQIAFRRTGAANRRTGVQKPADGRDFQAGRGRHAAAGQREIQRHLPRRASREARVGELHDIHHIAGLVAGWRGDRFRITVGIFYHRVDGDDVTAAVRTQCHGGDAEYLAILRRRDQTGVLRRIRGREHLDKRRITRRVRRAIRQSYDFGECPTGQRARRPVDRHRRNRRVQNAAIGGKGRAGERHRGIDRAGFSVQGPGTPQRSRPDRVGGSRDLCAGQRMQIRQQGLTVGTLCDVAAPEHDIGIGGEVIAPARDLRRVRRYRGGIQRGVADLHRTGRAISEEIDRGDAGPAVQRLGDLIDRVLGRVQDDDLDIAVHSSRQRLPTGDARIDEQQFGRRRIRRQTRDGCSQTGVPDVGLRADGVVGGIANVASVDVKCVAVVMECVRDRLHRHREAGVEQEPGLEYQLHPTSPKPRYRRPSLI